MNTWLTPMCQWRAADDATTFGIICMILTALLPMSIVLGFWPLLAWLGIDAEPDHLARHSAGEMSGLLATWRLYRGLRYDDHFSVPGVPSGMVPDSIAATTRDKLLASGPITALRDGVLAARRLWLALIDRRIYPERRA